MELFATLNIQRMDEQRAIEQLMASRDKRWMTSLGLKKARTYDAEGGKKQHKDVEQADPDVEMAALDEKITGLAMTERVANEQPRPLTMRLIRESIALSRHVNRQAVAEEKEIEKILGQKVLRLDWLDIGKIENLDAFTHVDELYLQYNLIERIEGLENHGQLTFLALAGNRIRKIQNLKHLINLKFLDLSMNYIDEFQVSELPTSLRVLRIAGNPFVRHLPMYAQFFFERLPNLVQVDQFRRRTPFLTSSLDKQTSLCQPSSPEQIEAELYQYDQSVLEKQHVGNQTVFNYAEYDKQRTDRMSKWRMQLTALTSKTRDQVTEKDEITRFHEKCNQALARARKSTDVALANAASEFKQMELAHQDWHHRSQQRRPSASLVVK